MIRFLKLLLVAIIVLGFVVPSFLSKSYAMDRSTTIDAPAAEISRVVGDLETWDSWTVWGTDADSTLERTFTGDAGEPGHTMTWSGETLGDGSIEITEVTSTLPEVEGAPAVTRIAYDMIFDGSDAARCAIVLSSIDDVSTDVRWEMGGELDGMPYMRYFGLMMDGMVGADFEAGLENLKGLVEGQARASAAGDAR